MSLEKISVQVGQKLTDHEAMALAIQEAKRGEGFVSPNPLVGCTILDSSGRFLSVGFHSAVGADHAEIDALKKVSDLALLEGAQVFVTLEPCAHQGRTPSCARHLASLPVWRIVYGLEDPNPLVSGKGAEILIEAGKQVEKFEDLGVELERLPEVFLRNMRSRRAWVSLKVASSLDGRVALNSGESQWITSEKSREFVQYLRGTHDAVLVGAGTVLKDNPSLDIRHPHFSEKTNKVIIIDPRGETLKTLPGSKLLKNHRAEHVYIVLNWEQRESFTDDTLKKECMNLAATAVTTPLGWQDARGWNYIFPQTLADGRVDLLDVSEKVFEKGICSILCEGGSRVFSSFLKQKAADRLVLFQNISVFGDGMSWGSGFTINNLNERIRLSHPEVIHIGEDLMISGRIQY